MKRTSILAVVTVTFMFFTYVYSQDSRSGRREPKISAEEQLLNEQRAKARGKEVLVERLPEGVEGVMLEEKTLRLKPGYKFVKKGGTVAVVARSASGGLGSKVLGSTGTFDCNCVQGTGDCEEFFIGNLMGCKPTRYNACTGACTLIIKRGGVATSIIMY